METSNSSKHWGLVVVGFFLLLNPAFHIESLSWNYLRLHKSCDPLLYLSTYGDNSSISRTLVIHTACASLPLKNSILAKKIGEGILKIFTPFGSDI